MVRADYHLHTKYSMDSTMEMDTLCRAAIKAGLNEICLTEHTEMGHPDPSSDKPPDVPLWLLEMERMRQKYPELTIRAGIEIGDNPYCRSAIKAWHDGVQLDFRLLSLHLIDNADPYFPGFFVGKAQDAVYRRYVECKLESVLAWEPAAYDAMAHLGYCAKFAPYPIGARPLMYRHAPDVFDALFLALASAGKAIEINTSGKRSFGEFLPDRELLLRFRQAGGEFVTLGSDAHRPEDVGRDLDDARELAKTCGFQYMLTFNARHPIPIKL